MSWKRFGLLVALVIGIILYAWRRDLLIALVIGALVMMTGRTVFRGYRTTKGPTGPPVDVDEGDTLLIYACETCGEQLVLLRRGTDAPPRHCSEKMVLRRVPSSGQGRQPKAPSKDLRFN
jgi:hypothetical protein